MQKYRWEELFVKETGLRDGNSGGLATCDADYAEDGDFRESRAGDEDAVGGRVEVGRRNLEAVVE